MNEEYIKLKREKISIFVGAIDIYLDTMNPENSLESWYNVYILKINE